MGQAAAHRLLRQGPRHRGLRPGPAGSRARRARANPTPSSRARATSCRRTRARSSPGSSSTSSRLERTQPPNVVGETSGIVLVVLGFITLGACSNGIGESVARRPSTADTAPATTPATASATAPATCAGRLPEGGRRQGRAGCTSARTSSARAGRPSASTAPSTGSGASTQTITRSGRRFVLVIAPDKSSIVPEHLPETYTGAACATERKRGFWARFRADPPVSTYVDLRVALLERAACRRRAHVPEARHPLDATEPRPSTPVSSPIASTRDLGGHARRAHWFERGERRPGTAARPARYRDGWRNGRSSGRACRGTSRRWGLRAEPVAVSNTSTGVALFGPRTVLFLDSFSLRQISGDGGVLALRRCPCCLQRGGRTRDDRARDRRCRRGCRRGGRALRRVGGQLAARRRHAHCDRRRAGSVVSGRARLRGEPGPHLGIDRRALLVVHRG